MNKLPMRDDEIANSYRLAKDPEEQVTVLADRGIYVQMTVIRYTAARNI